MKRNMINDNLIEFKPRYQGAVYGVKNGSYKAYVYDIGHEPQSWEAYRYTISLQQGQDILTCHSGANTIGEAKEKAKDAIKGRAFRAFLRRMG